MAEYKDILYETSDGVATITLNRLEKMNALGMQMRQDLEAALKEASEDDSIGEFIAGQGDGDKGLWFGYRLPGRYCCS